MILIRQQTHHMQQQQQSQVQSQGQQSQSQATQQIPQLHAVQVNTVCCSVSCRFMRTRFTKFQ